ncbi:hypothetical protein EB093_09740 [bacterium]|nr:hypothetical protein [bacterium]
MLHRLILTFSVPPSMEFLVGWAVIWYESVAITSQIITTAQPRQFAVNIPRRVGAIHVMKRSDRVHSSVSIVYMSGSVLLRAFD